MKKITLPQTGEFQKYGYNITISHPLKGNIDIDKVFKEVSVTVPHHLRVGLDHVYVGNFSFLNDRDLTAMYKENALFISNDQDNETDMVDDIVHELGHLVEENFSRYIYADGQIESEFMTKRRQLYHVFEEDKSLFNTYMPNYSDFLNPEYDQAFDSFLYKTVGYDNLRILTTNLFYSPYGATSLREYFANGFEAYFFHKDIVRIKNLSPRLYNKIKNLETLDEN